MESPRHASCAANMIREACMLHVHLFSLTGSPFLPLRRFSAAGWFMKAAVNRGGAEESLKFKLIFCGPLTDTVSTGSDIVILQHDDHTKAVEDQREQGAEGRADGPKTFRSAYKDLGLIYQPHLWLPLSACWAARICVIVQLNEDGRSA